VSDTLAQIDQWEPDTVAAGVTDAEATLATHGPVDEPLPLASVTKPMTAYGVLIAVHHGLLHLDEPAGPTADDGATVRHLLAHASGLPFEPDAPSQTPERRRVYSNWGYEVLGELVADRAGMAFAEHLSHEVFEPLGMDDTELTGSPAAECTGTVADLLSFARELLRPTLVPRELWHEATQVAFPGLDGVLPGYGRQKPNDWGLGPEIKDGKSPHWSGERWPASSFGHFGQSGSLLLVDPDAGIACVSLADQAFGAWARDAWPAFTDAIHEEFA
jgi:CubicO group peptidase (beta-lactamase class C family)